MQLNTLECLPVISDIKTLIHIPVVKRVKIENHPVPISFFHPHCYARSQTPNSPWAPVGPSNLPKEQN